MRVFSILLLVLCSVSTILAEEKEISNEPEQKTDSISEKQPGALELHNAARYSAKIREILTLRRNKMASIMKRLGTEVTEIPEFENQYKDFAETFRKAESEYFRKNWIEAKKGMNLALKKSEIAEKNLAENLLKTARQRLEIASTLLAECESAMVLKPEDACGSTKLLSKSRHQLSTAYSELDEAERLISIENFTTAIDSLMIAGVRARSTQKNLQDGGW